MSSRSLTGRTITAVSAIAAVGAMLTACTSASIQKEQTGTSSGKAQSSPPSASKPATASQSPSTTGPVGTTYKVTGTDSNGNNTAYSVTLDKVLSPAAPDNEFDAASSGKHLVGAEFTIIGISGTSSDDADNDTEAQGSDKQLYQPAFDGIAAGTNFNSGDFNVAPSATEVGWVVFEIPNSVKVASIQWNPSSGFSGGTATWTIAS
jgi:hypothetical protein